MNLHIAELIIEGRLYLVFPDDGRSDGGPGEYELAGVLEIDKKKYLIRRHNLSGDAGHSAAPADILTRRELQIVMLVAEGRVNKQIADQLKISEWTVSTHLRRIFAKMDVDSRAAMVHRCSALIPINR